MPAALAWVLAGMGAVPASAAAVCQGWTGAQPPPSRNVVSAVVSACDVWVIGQNPSDVGKLQFMHWTGGSSWVSVAGPDVETSELAGLAAVSATDIWAVGSGTVGSLSPSGTLIEHWDGSAWSQVRTPDLGQGSAGALYSVSAVSATDIWAVGKLQPQAPLPSALLIEHWDGSSWQQVRAPGLDPGFEASFLSVSAVSATSGWAVGSSQDSSLTRRPVLARWDGTQWTLSSISGTDGSAVSINAVSALSASNVWAVGNIVDSSGTARALIAHWDGAHWTPVTSPALGLVSFLFSVRVLSAGNAWATGDYKNSLGQLTELVEHWDGSAWSVVDGIAPSVRLLGQLAGAQDGTVWTAGWIDKTRAGAAEPVTGVARSELAVNVLGRNLRESGLVNGPFGNLSVASGTGPSVAMAPSGGFETAWTAANNHLWTVDSAGHRLDTMRLVAAGSGPSVTAVAGGGFEVAYPAADGSLWLMGPGGSFAQAPGPVLVAAGTSPAITAAEGGFVVAVHEAGSNLLVTVSGGAVRDTGVVLAAGSSPAVAGLAGGGFELAAHAAGADQLVTVGPSGVERGTGVTLAAGSSPAITSPSGVGFEIAGHAAGSDHLVTVTADGASHDAGPKVAAGTSPALAVLPDGEYQIAFTAAGSGDLATMTSAGPWIDTGIPMSAGTSPAVAASGPPPPATVTVPTVVGLDQPMAQDVLAAYGLRIGQVSPDTTCIDVTGAVRAQSPLGGAHADPGTAVNLTVSTGTDANGNPCIFK